MVVRAIDATRADVVGLVGPIVREDGELVIEQRQHALLLLEDGLVEDAVLRAFLGRERLATFHLLEQREIFGADLLAERVVRRVDAGFFVEQIDAAADLRSRELRWIERKQQDQEGEHQRGDYPEQNTAECPHAHQDSP